MRGHAPHAGPRIPPRGQATVREHLYKTPPANPQGKPSKRHLAWSWSSFRRASGSRTTRCTSGTACKTIPTRASPCTISATSDTSGIGNLSVIYQTWGVILLLYDQKHQIHFNARGSSLRFRDPTQPPSFEEYRYTHCLDKYIVLSPGETIEYHWQEYLGDFDLEKGSYTFQLRYVVPAPTDNKYSPLNRYERAWRKNPRLKNTTLFRSELNSRFYSFHLSKDIKRG